MWPLSHRIARLTMHHAALTLTMRPPPLIRLALRCIANTSTWQMMGSWEAARSTTCKCVLTIPCYNTSALFGSSPLLLWKKLLRITGTCTVQLMLVKSVLASTRLSGEFRIQTTNTLSSTSIWPTTIIGRGLNRTGQPPTHNQHFTWVQEATMIT